MHVLAPDSRSAIIPADVASRGRSLHRRVSAFLGAFPETKWLNISHLDTLIGLYDRSAMALAALEQAAGLPPRSGPVASPWGRPRGTSPRDAPILATEKWAALTSELKAIRSEAAALHLELQGIVAGSDPCLRRLGQLVDAADRVLARLRGLARRQLPDWAEADGVFRITV